MKKKLKIAALAVAGLLLVIQFIPVRPGNPPVTAQIAVPPEVEAVLRASCYDCHSNETHWPLYSDIAPVSWLISHDVQEAREHLNFSEWHSYSEKERGFFAEEIYEEVAEGEMPLPPYLLLHPGARVSEADLEVLRKWSESTSAEEDDDDEDQPGHESHDHP